MSELVQFKIGDTVRLKSGGPLMTIAGKGIDNNYNPHSDYWLCEWFDADKKPSSRSFHKDVLRHSDDKIRITSL